MTTDDAVEAATGGLAFMLLGATFHELARVVRVTDPARGAALLDDLYEGIAAMVQQCEAQQPSLVGNSILEEAASRVRTVVRAAQGPQADQG